MVGTKEEPELHRHVAIVVALVADQAGTNNVCDVDVLMLE